MSKATFLDRMVHIRDVAWGHSTAGYWVEWEEDGKRQIAYFKLARNAERFTRWLDTAKRTLLTKREVLAAHRALRDMEDTLAEIESRRPRRGKTMARLARSVRVRGHRRR